MDDKIIQASSSTAAVKAVPVSDDEDNYENLTQQETELETEEFLESPKEIDTKLAFAKDTETSISKSQNGNGINNNFIKSPSPTEITPPASVEPASVENYIFEIDEYTIADKMKQVI